MQLLRWCTAFNALPIDGLKEKVTFKHLVGHLVGGGGGGGDAAADVWLPVAHTCSYEVELLDYSTLTPPRIHPRTPSAYAQQPWYVHVHIITLSSLQVELPNYSSGERLREKVLRALQEMEGGGGFSVQ